MSTVQDINIPGSTSGTTLGDLTELAEEDGEEKAQELVDEMVDDGIDILESAGISAREPIESDYVSTNSIQDQVINGWAGAMNSYNSKLKIRGQEVSRSFKKMNEAMHGFLKGNDEDIGDESEGSSGPLEKNAFNIVVHELFHYNQDEELLGAVNSNEYSAEEFYKDFTKNIFDGMYEDEEISPTKRPSSFMNAVIDSEFKYAFSVLLSRMSRDQCEGLADNLSETYEQWRDAFQKSDEITEDVSTHLLWMDNGDNSAFGAMLSDSAEYDRKARHLTEIETNEEFEEYTEDLEKLIENNRENYDSEKEGYKSPDEALEDIDKLEDSKEELLENNREKKECEESVREYILDNLDRSSVGEPVTKPFKEAFAHMTTLALQGDLRDTEARRSYLDRVEEGYNSDTTWGYDEDAGTVLRGIVNTVIEENGEIEGSVEEQIGKIHELQSEYADQHRIEYSN